MSHKAEIRRVVYGTCVVTPPGGGSSGADAPIKVTVSVRRHRGCWGSLARTSRRVAVFTFQDQHKVPFCAHTYLDLEYIFRCSRRADAGAAEVHICAELRSGKKRVARVDLEAFLEQLLQSGRPEWFLLNVHWGEVVLLQGNQPLAAVPQGWLFDEKAKDTHPGSKGAKGQANNDPEVTKMDKSSKRKENSNQRIKENDHRDENAWKAENMFSVEDKGNDLEENENKIKGQNVEDIPLKDKEEDTLRAEGESGQDDAEYSSDSEWETLEEDSEEETADESIDEDGDETDELTEYDADDEDCEEESEFETEEDPESEDDSTDEESGLDSAEDTDGESGCEADDESSTEDSEEDSGGESGHEADDESSTEDSEEDSGGESNEGSEDDSGNADDEDSEADSKVETRKDSDESGWETAEDREVEVVHEANEVPQEGSDGGHSFLARMVSAWWQNRHDVLFMAVIGFLVPTTLDLLLPSVADEDWR